MSKQPGRLFEENNGYRMTAPSAMVWGLSVYVPVGAVRLLWLSLSSQAATQLRSISDCGTLGGTVAG